MTKTAISNGGTKDMEFLLDPEVIAFAKGMLVGAVCAGIGVLSSYLGHRL